MIRGAVRDLANASGLELARLVDTLGHDLHRLSDAERLEVAKATARLDAWTASIRASAILAVHDSARDDIAATTAELAAHESRPTTAGASHAYDDERLLHRRVGLEVALVLGVSTVAADREVDFALGLREHPQVRQALAEGRIDRTQAAVVLDGVDQLESATNQARVLTALLGPDDSPDGDDIDARRLPRPRPLCRHSPRAGARAAPTGPVSVGAGTWSPPADRAPRGRRARTGGVAGECPSRHQRTPRRLRPAARLHDRAAPTQHRPRRHRGVPESRPDRAGRSGEGRHPLAGPAPLRHRHRLADRGRVRHLRQPPCRCRTPCG